MRRDYGLAAFNRALEGASGTTCVHLRFGYATLVKSIRRGTPSCPSWRNAGAIGC